MSSQAWVQSGPSSFRPIQFDRDRIPGPLEPGVYRIQFDPREGFSLDLVERRFPLPSKVYGLHRGLVDRVTRTFTESSANVGVLLAGLRGTGKTVTGKVISNELDLPVILVERDLDGIELFLSSIEQPVVLFFDEFEKVFDEDKGRSLLSLLDGVASNSAKKLSILTANSLEIDQNFMDRPSRIRYRKEFGNLPRDGVLEIVEDRLADKQHLPDLIEHISRLKVITVDVVIALCDEVNRFGQSPKAFGDVFNTTAITESYDVVTNLTSDEEPKVLAYSVSVSPNKFEPRHLNRPFNTSGPFDGTIRRVHSETEAAVEVDRKVVEIRLVKQKGYNRTFLDA